MPQNANQHFVPQFYLRRFSSDGSSIGTLLRKTARVIPSASIKGQCSKRKYYDGAPGLDDFLTVLEGSVSRFLGMFADEVPRSFPGEKQIEHLLCFLTTQMHRTPMSELIGRELDRQFDAIISRGSPDGQGLPDEFRSDFPDHLMMVQIGIMMYPHLSNMMLTRIKAPRGMDFVTSDNPVVLVNKAGGQGRVPMSIGIASSGLIIVFPISPRYSILMYDPGLYTSSHDKGMMVLAKPRDVEVLNELQVRNCNDAVFFRSSSSINIDHLSRLCTERNSVRMDVTEYVAVGRTNRETAYREFQVGEDEGHGRSSLIGMSQLPVVHRFNPSFLKYRAKPIYDDTKSAAGWFRSRQLYELARLYVERMENGDERPFEFDAFLRKKNAEALLAPNR